MTKVITVILQFEQDSAFTVARPRFREHFTDVIRQINGNPNLGVLKSAHMALADQMNSIAPMDAKAYGTPTASLPKTWKRCNACTNDIACANNGGCLLATKAVDEAAERLKRARPDARITITGQSGVAVIEEDFLPEPPRRTERKRLVKEPHHDPKHAAANKAPRGKRPPVKRGAAAKRSKR